MPAAFAASIIDFVLDLAQAPTDQDAGNRVALEGLTLRPRNDGALEVLIRKFEAASLRLASGPLLLEIGQLAMHELAALVRVEAGRPRLQAFEAAGAELFTATIGLYRALGGGWDGRPGEAVAQANAH